MFPLARSFGQRKALEFLGTTSRLPSLWTWFFNAFIRKIELLYKRRLDRASRDGKDFDYECRLLMPQGLIKHVHVVAHAVGNQVDQLEFIGAVMDATKARRVQEQMHQARADLAHVARVMTIGELTAAGAHGSPAARRIGDPRQRLLALVGAGTAQSRRGAEFGGGHDRQRHTSRGGHQSVAGHDEEIAPHRDLLNINDAILAVIALVGAEAQRNRVSLRTELSNDLPLVLGDRIQLQQVILNLIMNAIEAMRGIDQTQRKVLVVSRKDEFKGALVEVQDWGAGLEGHALERLFDAFYTTKPDGMGIGLAVSRTIIDFCTAGNSGLYLMYRKVPCSSSICRQTARRSNSPCNLRFPSRPFRSSASVTKVSMLFASSCLFLQKSAPIPSEEKKGPLRCLCAYARGRGFLERSPQPWRGFIFEFVGALVLHHGLIGLLLGD